MPNDSLHPCPSCARHVRGSATECPFCAAAIPARALDAGAPAASGVTAVAPRNRAQLMGFGVAVGTAAVATALMTSACIAAYGAPVPDDDAGSRPDATSAVDAASDPDSGGPAPAYGTPAP